MKKTQRQKISSAVKSNFIILTPDGEEVKISSTNKDVSPLKNNPYLKAVIDAEFSSELPGIKLPSIKAMQELELVDYEPASDKGHFRFYPKGALIFDLLRLWAEKIAIDQLGAYSIETPLIYSWDEPDIREQAESFHEHHYIVHPPDKPAKKFILRFAGDFGLFRMMRDAQMTYKHFPIRLYECAPSFRYEFSGNLTGLKRLRGFWMPDVHSFCLNLEQGIEEYMELYRQYIDLANGMDCDYAVAFRVVESFYREHKEKIVELVKYNNSPAFVELMPKMKHYWIIKHEVNTVDGAGGICQTSTVQLDIKDASLYGINYIDSNGKKQGCTIIHSSIGSLERWMFSILEKALKHKSPTLPLWLCPIQVRVIPVSERKHLDFCLQMADKLKQHQIRVDVDDRRNSLGWRIRAAEREWIPYTIVVGDKEKEAELLTVRVRGSSQVNITVPGLIGLIKKQTEGMPFRSFPGLLVSKRPVFRSKS